MNARHIKSMAKLGCYLIIQQISSPYLHAYLSNGFVSKRYDPISRYYIKTDHGVRDVETALKWVQSRTLWNTTHNTSKARHDIFNRQLLFTLRTHHPLSLSPPPHIQLLHKKPGTAAKSYMKHSKRSMYVLQKCLWL